MAAEAFVAELLERCDFPPAPAPTAAPGLALAPAAERRPTVAAAVSGGADSMAMLALACASGLSVIAIHVDHGLRADSAAEAAIVAHAANRFGARFESIRVCVPAGGDLEARARAARYRALPPDVLVGHTADDQAETVLVNLMRGAGLDGLRGIPTKGPRKRPVIGLRRHETQRLCRLLGLQIVEDPSNCDSRFVRNRVRSELLGLLADISGRDPVPLLVRQAKLLNDDAELLDQMAATLDPTDASALTASPRPLARRALRHWLRANSDEECHPPSFADVERVLGVAGCERKGCEITGGRRVSRSAGRLRIEDAVMAKPGD